MKFNGFASYNTFVKTNFGLEGTPKDVVVKGTSYLLSLYGNGGVLVLKDWKVESSSKEVSVEFVGSLPAGSIMPVKGRQALQCDGVIVTDGTTRWQVVPVGGNMELQGALSAFQSTLERVIATQEGREAAMGLIGEYFPDLSVETIVPSSEDDETETEAAELEIETAPAASSDEDETETASEASSEEDELAKLMAEESASE